MSSVPSIATMIRELIRRPSVSCTDAAFDQSNRAVIDVLAEWLDALGFQICITPVAEGKANLLATLGGGLGSGEGLVLAGHTDTVPYDEQGWSCDPFGGVEKDGRIYGLGSCDMKGFFALAIAAAANYSAQGLRHPLTLLATADEESSMSGARHLYAQGIKPGRFAVIGEPTGLRPMRMHKGVMMESIRVRGAAGHSSDPSLGASAIEGMHVVIAELLRWRAELQQRYRNPLFKVDAPTLNLGSIHGGDNPNRICAHCELHIDIRPLPGMDLEELRQTLSQRLGGVLQAYPRLHVETHPLFDGLPPFETGLHSEIVRACERYSGQTAGAVVFGTEAPFLAMLGTQTVILGPGDIEQAHQPDEYLALSRIAPMVGMLERLIGQFCL